MNLFIKIKSLKINTLASHCIILIGFITLLSNEIQAQCNGGFHAGDLTATISWQTVNVNTFTYYTFTASSVNEHFTFTFCQGGGNHSLDTQLEVHDNTGASIGYYNDDACGTGSEIMFTAPAAGTYRISIYEYNCETTTNLAGTLAYKRSDGTNEQDCIGALSVCQETYNQTESYFGYGNIMDYVGDSDCSGLCLDPEDNSVWYTFQVQASGILDFRITPIDPNSDYDWALFNLTNHDCSVLQDISNHYDLITSCNAAYDYGPTGANTLTPNTNSDCAPPSSFGSGIINNQTISVTEGEIYYLNIQNWSATQGGYTLDFSHSTASIFDNNPPLVDLLADPFCQDNSFTIHFNENVDCSTVGIGDFILTGPGGPFTITGISAPACDIGGSMERDYTISFSPAIIEEGDYSIEYNGNATDMCGNMTSMQTWNFNITSLVDINLTSAASTADQSICEGENIQNIIYNTNLADNVTFNGLPDGVNGNFDTTSGNITISGTPNVTGSFNYTIDVDGDCGHTSASGTITISQNTTPAFSTYGPYCLNQSPDNLPTVSSNGISGTWSPSENINTSNPGTFTYTFTPSPDECAPIVTIDIIIIDSESPVFDTLGPYCQNETPDALPTTSNNGITGYWIPSVINTNSPGNTNYTFNPTSGDCTSSLTITITTHENPITTVNISEPLDCNGENGEVSVSAVGGNTPYNGTGSFPVNNGTHQFTVTDANGCEDMEEIILTAPDPMIGTIEKESDILCAGDRTGKIRINISQGEPEYTANWGSSSQSSIWHEFFIDELNVGIYDITVTDIHGCTISDRVIISEPAPLNIEYKINEVSCKGNDDGSVDFFVSGGIPPYIYMFNGISQDTSFFNHLEAGDYSGIIIDENGCQISTDNIYVDENPVDCLRIPDAFTPNEDGVNDTWDIENLDMFPYAEVRIFNRWGQLLYVNKNHNNENWDGTYNNSFVPTGSYLYVIQTYTTAEPVTGIVTVVY